MESNDYQRLIEKLKRIEALFADRAATIGEKVAAGEARERIRQRLAEFTEIDPPIEYTFALRNPWDEVFATINYGWEDEAFYSKRMGWDPTEARKPDF